MSFPVYNIRTPGVKEEISSTSSGAFMWLYDKCFKAKQSAFCFTPSNGSETRIYFGINLNEFEDALKECIHLDSLKQIREDIKAAKERGADTISYIGNEDEENIF